MAKVHFVKKAQKDHPEIGVKKGEPYYWWAMKTGPVSGITRKSKTPPKRSQLTSSDYFSRLWDLQDGTEWGKCECFSDLESLRDDVVSQLEELRDEQDEKKSNMPEGLQEGDTGQLLQERYDSLDSAISDLQGVDIPDDEEVKKEVREEITSVMDKKSKKKKEEEKDIDEQIEEGYKDRLTTIADELDAALASAE